ncbi:MAG: PIG-L family deacetylase [Bacteroidia bacterium]
MNYKWIILSVFFFLKTNVTFSQATQSFNQAEIEQQFNKLRKGASVLYLAAHPDDENTRLISYLANGLCLRTGYLSLTRGDGGQNLIGPEQGTELGVIRTRELMAARMKDGGEQYFTRAYDFGYSKNPEETFSKWNKELILADVVYVIRKFKPDVIITRFATDGSGGHGHHTASALLAEEAFVAAADPNKFPEQLSKVQVWKTKRLFHNSTARFFNPNADLSHLIKLDVGGFNSILGKSYGEIAAESRSMHKSQGFGSALQRGEQFEYFKPIMGDTNQLSGNIFNRLELSNLLIDPSGKYQLIIEQIFQSWKKNKLDETNKLIFKAQNYLKQLGFTEEFYHLKLLENLIISINGIFLESTIEKSALIAKGDSISIKLFLVSRLNPNIEIAEIVLQQNGAEKNCEFAKITKTLNEKLKLNIPYTSGFKTILCNGNLGNLYWLNNPPVQSMFQQELSEFHCMDYAQDFEIPIRFKLKIGNNFIVIKRKAFHKQVDPEKGELHRNFVAINPIQIEILNDVLISTNGSDAKCKVKLKSYSESKNTYEIGIKLPENWECPNKLQKIELQKEEEKIIEFQIQATTQSKSGSILIWAKNEVGKYQSGIKEIKYNHIPTQVLLPESEGKLVNLDLKRSKKNIAYIQGAGDEVASCLKIIGYDVTELDQFKIANEDLSKYESIVFGVRAFNTIEGLSKLKTKFNEYMNNGGTIVVQYNTNSWAGPLQSDIGPYKFKITRDRITDENASVKYLQANHPALNIPNKITQTDFENWVQERGIYFAGELDSNYVSLLSMADPGEKENNGSLIISKVGKGYFVYTGLAFFRQLPAGVPGAYRLFVNLIELK